MRRWIFGSGEEFLDVDHSWPEDDGTVCAGVPHRIKEDGPLPESQHASDTLDPTDQALVSLVIRGMVRGAPDPTVGDLVDRGYAMIKGPITMPTAEGTAAAGALLRLADDSPVRADIDTLFDAFLPVNRRLRDVCSAWQSKPDGTPNDHGDSVYHDNVREQLDEVHSAIGPILRRLAAVAPRIATYRPRLQAALDRFDDGESSWLASPLMDSYHTVWMHLHQELILMLGLTRAEDEAREERLVSGRAG